MKNPLEPPAWPRRLVPLLLCALFGAAAPHSPCQELPQPMEMPLETTGVGLRNGLLGLTFLPDTMGRLSQIRHLPQGLDLLIPYRRKMLKGNPLFQPTTNNTGGIRELFWGRSVDFIKSDLPMTIVEHTDSRIVFRSDHYGNQDIGLERTVHLLPDAMRIDCQARLVNNGDRPQSFSLWFNILPVPPIDTFLPVKGGLQPLRGRGSQKFCEEDAILPGTMGEARYPAAAPWVGACLKGAGLTLVFAASPQEMLPDGFIYTWGGRLPEGTMHTFEPVLGTRTLAPGRSCIQRYSLLLLPQIKRLVAFAQDTGFDAEIEGRSLKLTIAAAQRIPARTGQIYLRQADSVVPVAAVSLPALTPRRSRSLRIAMPARPMDGHRLAGLRLNGQDIDFIGVHYPRP